jgi:hypothetical protein
MLQILVRATDVTFKRASRRRALATRQCWSLNVSTAPPKRIGNDSLSK